jgi:Xaa-Pro aminopeptidase
VSVEPRPIVANLERLYGFMDQYRLAAVVARSGQNFTYLSGIAYPGTLARHLDFPDSARGVMLVWPRNGEPVLILNRIAEGVATRDSWIKRIALYDAYRESPYRCLCQVITETGLARERIGVERTYLSAASWAEITRALPHVQMVDCAVMMDEVRWVKTSGEIALLKRGADLLDDAYLEVFPTIRIGETERDVHSRMIYSCLRRGANWAHGILNSSTNLVPYTGEGDTVFRRGDVVRTDYVAYVDGYPGHQSRNAVLGRPSAAQRHDYALVRDIYRMTIDRCRPGVSAGTLYQFVTREFERHGWEYQMALVGHGVGPWWHQQEPILTRGSEVVLEEGMVLAMEPQKDYWHLQDMILVREAAPQLLSDKFSTDQMFLIE